jgi:ABC-type antimicrobial peptide transport system permease subunit
MKEITVIFFCTWKFAATFPVAVYVMKMSFLETIICTNIGGAIGVLIFIFFSHFLINLYTKYWPEQLKRHRKPKRVFNKRNRWLVKIKIHYGLPGIVILTPILLSIPVGSFLVAKYYGRRKFNYLWLILGQIAWSFVFTGFYAQIKAVI